MRAPLGVVTAALEAIAGREVESWDDPMNDHVRFVPHRSAGSLTREMNARARELGWSSAEAVSDAVDARTSPRWRYFNLSFPSLMED